MNSILLMPAVLLVGVARISSAAEVDYSRDIRPLLSDKCFRCHGPDAGHRKADLRLDVRRVVVEVGAITPGDPNASAILERVTSKDPDFVMPPPKKRNQSRLTKTCGWICTDKHGHFLDKSQKNI